MLLFAGFGWAKPVQFNEKNLRNPRTDVMKIAMAGPVSNAMCAIIFSFLLALFDQFIYHSSTGLNILRDIIVYAVYLNWGLFVFNMIPIPPLDGSHLLLNYFRKYPALYSNMYKYGSFFFFGLILVMVFTKIDLIPIWPVVRFLGDGILSFFENLIIS
jgi:Zn-dependent protease